MAKSTPEQKLAALAQEVGFEKLDSMFRLLRAYNTPKKVRRPKSTISPELAKLADESMAAAHKRMNG